MRSYVGVMSDPPNPPGVDPLQASLKAWWEIRAHQGSCLVSSSEFQPIGRGSGPHRSKGRGMVPLSAKPTTESHSSPPRGWVLLLSSC